MSKPALTENLLMDLLDLGCSVDELKDIVRRLPATDTPVTELIRILVLEGGRSLDAITPLIGRWEEERSASRLYRPLYQREPRTKKYGPAQDPDSYMSAEKLRAYNHGYTFKASEIHFRLPENEWLPLVGRTFRRDGHTCTYCGADGETYKLHCDHIVPISRGGTNDAENLTTACDYCNCSKRDALPHEWRPLRADAQ